MSYDFRLGYWTKYGNVVFVADPSRALEACRAAEPGAEVFFHEVRPSSAREWAAHEARVQAYREWMENARKGVANRKD